LSLNGGDTVRRGVATKRLSLLRGRCFLWPAHQFIGIDVPGRARCLNRTATRLVHVTVAVIHSSEEGISLLPDITRLSLTGLAATVALVCAPRHSNSPPATNKILAHALDIESGRVARAERAAPVIRRDVLPFLARAVR